jgi:hypothetical protein
MKKTYSGYLAVIVGLSIFVGLLSPLLSQRKKAARQGTQPTNTIVVPKALTAAPSALHQIASNVPVLKEIEGAKAYQNAKNVPVNFWGKVLDERDKPIAGVKIELSVESPQIRNLIYPDKVSAFYSVETDTNGLFSLINAKGDVLEIRSLEKEGYRTPPVFQRTFGYATSMNHVPKSNEPVIFKMLSQLSTTTNRLVELRMNGTVKCDGTPLVIDPMNKRQSEGADAQGDIRIRFIRNPVKLDFGVNSKYDWELTVEILNGGLILAKDNDVFLNEAPETGYQPDVSFVMRKSSSDWIGEKKIVFYYRTQGSKYYGQATLEINMGYLEERTGFQMNGTMNAAGGRILQDH